MRMFWPSQFPPDVTPNTAAVNAPSGSPRTASNSARSHTKNLPSSPSVSASWAAANAPPAVVISRST